MPEPSHPCMCTVSICTLFLNTCLHACFTLTVHWKPDRIQCLPKTRFPGRNSVLIKNAFRASTKPGSMYIGTKTQVQVCSAHLVGVFCIHEPSAHNLIIDIDRASLHACHGFYMCRCICVHVCMYVWCMYDVMRSIEIRVAYRSDPALAKKLMHVYI